MYQQGPQHVVAVGVGDQTLQVIWPSKPQHVDVPGRWLPVEDGISGNYVKYYVSSIEYEHSELKMSFFAKKKIYIYIYIFNIAFEDILVHLSNYKTSSLFGRESSELFEGTYDHQLHQLGIHLLGNFKSSLS